MTTQSGFKSRLRIAAALLALIAVSVAVTWLASSRIRSPAEVAARTMAPEPSPILVPVEMRTISSSLVTRGTGRFGSPQTLRTASTALKSSAGYVDVAPKIGDGLGEGDIAFVVSGRPVFVLVGEQPAYRDLGPGLSGADVQQLEQSLQRLGFDPGVVDGMYDETTEQAVSAWYLANGFAPLAETSEQRAAIRSIESDLSLIERETISAAEMAAAARAEVVAAQEANRIALLAASSAEAAVALAVSQAESANAAAEGELAAAKGLAAVAWRQRPGIYAPDEEQQRALTEWEVLQAGVETAQANADLVRATGAAAVSDAERAALAAPGEVEGAAAAVSVAQLRLQLASEAAELAGLPRAQIAADLTAAEQRAGVQVPADEIIFVKEVPIRVSEVHVARGDEAVGALLSVTDAVVAIDGDLALDQVALVELGMKVEISEPDLGIVTTGVVSAIADRPGTRGADGFHVWFETFVTDGPSAATAVVGASVRLTLAIESSGGPVLAVPASALTLAADGSSRVLVERGGELESVVVEPGLASRGYVATSSTSGVGLTEGDLVVIGFEQRLQANG